MAKAEGQKRKNKNNSAIRNPQSEIQPMIYPFLKKLHSVLTKGMSGKAWVTIGAGLPVGNLPHVHLRVGKLHWGQSMLDSGTRSQTEQELIFSVHRSFEQVGWIDVVAAAPNLLANTTTGIMTVCLTELDSTIQTYNQENPAIPVKGMAMEAYSSVCVVKTVQWLSHKPNLQNPSLGMSLKFKVSGDFKAMKRVTEGMERIQTIVLTGG